MLSPSRRCRASLPPLRKHGQLRIRRLGVILHRRRGLSQRSAGACQRTVAIEATFAQFMEMGGQVDVEMIHLLARGPIVMTKRVDHLTRADGTTISLSLMGVIEVHDGCIAAWRDYFDLSQFTSQLSGESRQRLWPTESEGAQSAGSGCIMAGCTRWRCETVPWRRPPVPFGSWSG